MMCAQADGTGAQQPARRGVRDWLLRRPHPPPVQRRRAALDAEARADGAASAGDGLMVRSTWGYEGDRVHRLSSRRWLDAASETRANSR